jgi:SAM-dependent methyltransferase
LYDFIRKPFLWKAWDSQLHKMLPQTAAFHLKTIQDLAVFDQIKDMRGRNIAEMGGGASRLLQALSETNTCANIERFEGVDGGPKGIIEIPGVTNYLTFLGEFSPELPEAHFDVVFSVSVIEHVPTDKLKDVLEDGLRILKPGGLFLHAIDMYVEDEPSEPFRSRFEAYRQWFALGTGLEPTGPVFDGALAFSCDMATNPDNTMYEWGKVAPSLIELRQRAQSVSLLLSGRKAALRA